MIRSLMRMALGAALTVAIQASPAIYLHSVVNGASFYAPGLPGGSIAQGSMFSIFGAALGPAKAATQSSFPLTTNFSGVSIQVSQGTTSVSAIPLYVSASQINGIMPSNAPLGWSSVVVTFNGNSNPSPVYIVHDSPGIFTSTGTGIGPGAVQNALENGKLESNSYQASASPGQIVQIYLTGLGPITTSDNQAPPSGSPATPVQVWVGGVSAKVSYSGRSPCCAGLDQIDFVVPASAPQGCWVPVYLQTSNVNVSNFASMAISAKGGACSDPSNALSSLIRSGGTLGVISLMRMVVHEDIGVNAPIDVSNDYVSYSASNIAKWPFSFLPFQSRPPPGSCAVYPGVGDFLQSGSVPEVAPAALDGGTQLSISGPGGQQSVTTTLRNANLGSFLPLYGFPNQLFLKPGSYTVKTNGGTQVPGFTASVTVPAAPTWTNQDQISTVSRSQPLTLNWSGAIPDQPVGIMGVGSDLPTNSSAVFFCVAPAGASTFTVPAAVIHSLPYGRANPLASKDVIYLISASASSFPASGLSLGAAGGGYVLGKTVTFQ